MNYAELAATVTAQKGRMVVSNEGGKVKVEVRKRMRGSLDDTDERPVEWVLAEGVGDTLDEAARQCVEQMVTEWEKERQR